MNTLYLGGICNNNCYSCSNKINVNKSLKSLKDEISHFDKNEPILIKGGEPTIYPYFFELLEYLKNLNYKKIMILTNGRMFSYLNNVKKISLYKNVEFLIKLLGSNSLIHDNLTRMEHSFEQTISGIMNLQKERINFSVIITVLEQNFVFLEKMIILLNRIGTYKIIISSAKPSNNKNYTQVVMPFHEMKNILYRLGSLSNQVYFEDIPFCFLAEKKNKALIDSFSTISELKQKFVSEKCKSCLNFDLCPKIWNSYFNIYSDDFLETKQDLPEEIGIEITSRCNLDCKFCFKKNIYKKDFKQNLDLKDLKKIIDKIPKEIGRIRITGGEPLMNEDFFEMLGYIHNKGFKVWLNTNATLITESIAKDLSKYVENVLIPLNGFDENSEKNNTNYDSLKQKLEGIALLKKHKIGVIRCGTVATKENIINIEKIYSLILKLKIDDWELYRPIPNPTNLNPIDLDDLRQLSTKLYDLNRKFNKRFKIVNSVPFCSVNNNISHEIFEGANADDGHIRFVVGTDFIVRPSYYIKEQLGDIRNNSIIDIWGNNFMKNMRNLKFVPKECSGCFDISKCMGGSRFSSNLIKGSYSSPDPLMPLVNKDPSVSEIYNKFIRYHDSIKKEGKIPDDMYPNTLRIKLTRNCNLNCKMCYIKKGKENNLLSFKIIRSLLHDLKEMGGKNVVLTGGEPLMREDITQIIEEINRLKLNGTLYTNGTLLNDSFCKALIKNNWRVMVSIDGPNAAINDKIRGIGSFKKSMIGLKSLIKYRKRYNLGYVFTRTVIQDDNFNKIEDIKNLLKKEDVDFSEFAFVIPFKKHFKKRKEFGLELKSGKFAYLKGSIPYIDMMTPYLINGKIEDDVLANFFNKQDLCCLSLDELVISPEGEVYNCCDHFHKNKFVVGNINNESIKLIWFGKKLNELRKNLLKLDTSLCGGCNTLINSMKFNKSQNE